MALDQVAERRGVAAKAYRLVLAAGLLVMLAANLPGHLSVDSVVALEEARTGVRQTWAPAAFSGVLHIFDRIVAGTGLYVTASSALLFFSLLALPRLRPRTSWAAAVVAVLAIATPQVMIYQGIVWRDVLFANLTLAGFVFLAAAAQDWGKPRPWLSLIGALACLALASAVRQNGLVMALAAAVALAWTVRREGWRSVLAWGGGGLTATIVLAIAFNLLAQPHATGPKARKHATALILQHYDVVGAVAHEPGLRLEALEKANLPAAQLIETKAPKIYSAARIDTLDVDDQMRQTLWHLPDAAMNTQWREVILQHPGAYLAHRLDVFHWVLLTPNLQMCLPVQVGVAGPADMLQDLEIADGVQPQSESLAAYASRFYRTPIYSHAAFGLLALAVAGVLLWRRDPADCVIAAMLVGALGFAASFFVISVACDYRYLYLVDLAALAGAIYLALDPPRLRRA